MSAQSPFKLQEAGPTVNALRAAMAVLHHDEDGTRPEDFQHGDCDECEDLARQLDEKAGIKELIGAHNDLVLDYEDERELRLRLGSDLKDLKAELAQAYQDAASIAIAMDAKVNALREAMQQGILALRLIASQPDKFACQEVKSVSRDAADELEKAIAVSKVERGE